MEGCRKYEELLARHLHGGGLLPDREELEKHLAICPDCERLYCDVSDLDRLLRDLPGKEVEPPGYLFTRIIANVPEGATPQVWWRWGRWAAGFGAVAACALAAALSFYRGALPPGPRVAYAPPASPAPAPAVLPPGAPGPAGEEAQKVPSLRSTPGAPKREGGTAVASATKVRVIQQVKIFFYYPPAQKVSVTGDFNGWNVDGVPMQDAGKPGLWTTELRLPPGVYSYNFIVDGELLLPDPNATNQMPDGYGGTNSILLVRGENAI